MKGLYSLFTCLVLTLTLNSTYCQKSFMKFGNISDEELTMSKYDKDTSAGAVVLGDFGVTRFIYTQDQGFTLEFNRHLRIKILDKKALDEADISFYLWVGKGGREEELGSLKAFTYNYENGEAVKTKMEKDAIFSEMANKNQKRVKFSLPNVKVGSVLEISYSIKSPFLFNLNEWQFQSNIPSVRSEYHVFVPEYFSYKNWTTGYIPIEKITDSRTERFQYHYDAEITPNGRTSGGMDEFEARVDHWTYIATNVPAFIPEPKITTLNDYLAYVEFELLMIKYPWSVAKYFTNTWEKINEELMDDEDFGKQLKRGGQFKDIITTISTSEPQKKMIYAYEYIKNKMVWDGRYRVYPSSYGNFPANGIAKAFKDGGGASSDINLNLICLLREMGFIANPVLVSTRSNGMLRPGQVILSQFNHVIAAVQLNDKLFLLDATDPYCPYFILPPNTLNDKGMMISETGFKWVDLYSKISSQENLIGQISITNDLSIEGKISKSFDNFSAMEMRKDVKAKTNLDEFKKKLEAEFNGAEINDFNVENLDSLYKPLKMSMNIKVDDQTTEGADMVYFNPILFERVNENIFKKESREYPVDFNFPTKKKYTFSIKIPDGYTVAEMPASIRINLPDDGGKFNYLIGNTGNIITVSCELSINQTIFPSTNYLELKKFYEMVVAKMAEQVVIKKIA